MALNNEGMKAYNRDPAICWECYNCVKICPQQAIGVKSYADFVPMGASVTPLRGTEEIMWTNKFKKTIIKKLSSQWYVTNSGGPIRLGPTIIYWFFLMKPIDIFQELWGRVKVENV